jgi:hypothetical protein
MSNVRKGIELALANALVLAIGFAGYLPSRTRIPVVDELALWLVGGIVAIPCGALLGFIAGRLRRERLATLLVASFVVLPVACVLACPILGFPGAEALADLIAVAWIPTSFATIALERWTRPQELPSAWVVDPLESCSGSPERRARRASCT